jgi:hypothetical protein
MSQIGAIIFKIVKNPGLNKFPKLTTKIPCLDDSSLIDLVAVALAAEQASSRPILFILRLDHPNPQRHDINALDS